MLEVLGEPVRRAPAVPDGVAGFVDGPGLYPSLTARQNLAALAALRGRGGRREVDDALAQVGLSDVADDRLRGFSLGMRQRLGLAAALLSEPRLLVLDEPSNGLDPAGTRQVHRVLRGLAAQGTAVVVSSHRMDDVAALCAEVDDPRGRPGGVHRAGRQAGRRGRRARPPAGHRRPCRRPAGRPRPRPACGVVPPATARCRTTTPSSSVAPVAVVDDLVARLVGAGIAVRELAPVVPPLEAAFLALTGADASCAAR